ncbi:MAG: DUF2182 domain-containing protein [Trinickia sp.]|uniref:DUF2182 domain-containing protein n=1 Tax=Trinickia sp. TaxID=2571163 RepID=UPI003F7F9CFD
MSSVRTSHAALFAASALLFAASAVTTVMWSLSMSSMGEMPMPGGWSMSMTWMPTCGETWLGAAASFVGMWTVMMVAMMLPSLVPMLMRYREAIGAASRRRREWLTALVGIGYFAVWTALGVAVFALGSAVASAEMRIPALARIVPLAVGSVALAAGALQFTAWKARQLACCKMMSPHCHERIGGSGAALRHGLHLGLRCSNCCIGLTALLLVAGVMNLGAMALVTVAITAERLSPVGERIARGIGAVLLLAGVLLIARAAGFSAFASFE